LFARITVAIVTTMKENVAAEDFVAVCRQAVAQYEHSKQLGECAGLIIGAWPEESAHPMLHEIHGAALAIDEEYWSEAENQANWQHITTLLQQYLAGDWSATCWRLSIAYGLYEGETFLQHSFTVVIIRVNGVTDIYTAEPELRQALADVINKVQPDQSDEWYLRNVAFLSPARVGDFRLMGASAMQGST